MTLADPSQLLEDCQVASSPLESLRSETLKTLAKVSEHLFFRLKRKCWLMIDFLTIVTSQWHYSRDSDVKLQDKDFKRLNKSALGNRATTAHVSTMRKPPIFHSQPIVFFPSHSNNTSIVRIPTWESDIRLNLEKLSIKKLRLWKARTILAASGMEALADKDLKSWPLLQSFHQTRMWVSRTERHWDPLPRSRPCWETFTERYKGMSTVRRPETSEGLMRISDSKCSIHPRLTLAQVLWPILLWTKVQSRSRCKIRKMPRVFSRWKSSFRSSHAPAHRILDTNQSSDAWQLLSTLAGPTQSLNVNGEILLDDCLKALTCLVLSTPMLRIGD